MYNDIFSNDLIMNEAESFSGSRNDSMFDLLYSQILDKQNKQKREERARARKEEQARKENEAKRNSSTFFCMSFKNDVDKLNYLLASNEEREAIKRKQMEERGLIQKAEEVVETVKEVATRTVSGLRLRMNILKIMKEKKSYSYVTYNNGKVSENTLDVAFNMIKEISAMATSRIVLAADNAIFNRSMFPDTS